MGRWTVMVVPSLSRVSMAIRLTWAKETVPGGTMG